MRNVSILPYLRELIEIRIDLPFPPSLNSIWRYSSRGHVHVSAKYTTWMHKADALGLYLKQTRGQKINGPFTADIICDKGHRKPNHDIDNLGKVVLDLAQRWELIRNDCDCESVHAYWGRAEHGCRLILTEWDGIAWS